MIKNLKVTGEKLPVVPVSSSAMQPLESYALNPASRAVQESHTINLHENDKLLQFVFTDDTSWLCDASTLHELFPETDNPARGEEEAFPLPAAIKNADAERGFYGDVALKVLNVFAKKAVSGGVGRLANKLEDKLMEEGEGLFRLSKNFSLSKPEITNTEKPFLLFIHGTNSNTRGAFAGLNPSGVWDFIMSAYGNNVLSFQHRSLTKSPLQNVVDLAEQLPADAELHIISHSRGGLVGDILSRYSVDDSGKITGFTETNLDLLRKEGKREEDVEAIQQLNKAFAGKQIRVTKFIRVACPGSGTQLASRRLDIILNVLYNLFGGALNPVADMVKELIAETLRTKDNVAVLPGIEAMNPDSPFIKILNDRSEEVAIEGASLMVISGNGKLSLGLSGLFVILGKLFYWQRNDLVVNTDSMYLGANRRGNIQYFFDQGATVDHLKYFVNPGTQSAIQTALKTVNGEQIPGFTCVAQHEVPASDRALLEHGEFLPYKNVPSGKKPILVLLPGIMGSNLSRNGSKVWLAYLKMVFGGLTELQHIDDKTITADSLITTSYKQLADRLSLQYDVIIYPFDWRRSLKDTAKSFNDKISQLLKYEQPVKIIGHSMGGVLVRDFIVYYPETWKQLNNSKGFRLLFLGAPLGGSFRIPAVLFGFDGIINSLNMLDTKHTKKELIGMFSTFPGILSLLPMTSEGKYDFANIQTWKDMAEANGDSDWPLPSPSVLADFKDYREHISAAKDQIDYTHISYIAGKDKFTPSDYFNDMIPPRTELVFLGTGEGDQSVTWESGIPKQLIESQSVYYVPVTHGALANEPEIFEGIEEIVAKGSTNRLSRSRPIVRGDEQVFRMPKVFNFDLSERGLENAVMGITEKQEKAASQVPVSISVSHGDLAFASYPVLAGHFINDGILYAEKSIDYNVNKSLSSRYALGLYPGEIGTNTVVATDVADSDFKGAIIVGLGEPGNLTSFLLTKTVEQGVSKYLLNLNSRPGADKEAGISALIIGCGYGGLTVENSVKAIIEGVNAANTRVSLVHKNATKLIRHIEFIELYEDKALSCLYTLRKIENKENRSFSIRIGNKKIRQLFGSRKRLPVEMSDEWWNRITVRCKKFKEGDEETSSLVFGASTGDAREEETELFSSTSLIDLYIEQASIQNQWTSASAKTLFELMIPTPFKDRLKKKGSISWILDKDTAAYPWELLQENIGNSKPLCIDAGMIRQMSTTQYRLNIKRVATEKALVVADPELNGFVSQLKGAEKEGKAVQDALTTFGYPNVSLINKNASDIILNLFSNDFKIIHLAGHGVYNPNSRKKSGMVIGNDVFLTTADIEQLSTVPELVFVNCCHLGKQDGVNDRLFRDRYKLAANIGTQLIEIGVKAVVAAGWAVDDAAALDFANTFYAAMFGGDNFGDAVRKARSLIYEKYHTKNNTWGAYQCYGDPFYKLINRSSSQKEQMPDYVIEEEAAIDLNNLKNDLDTRNITTTAALDRLKLISQAIDKAEISTGEIAEIEALIYYELGEYDQAIAKYDSLRKGEKASFSVAALEKFCNCRSKKFISDLRLGGSRKELLENMNTVIDELQQLTGINRTSERLNLLGSAFKRKAMISHTKAAKTAAYNQAAGNYHESYKTTGNQYALNNWLPLQSALYLAKQAPGTEELFDGQTREQMIALIGQLKKPGSTSFKNLDYWEWLDDIANDLTLLVLDESAWKNDDRWQEIETRFKRIWKRSGSRGKRLAELESLEIMSDVLGISESTDARYLQGRIEQLRKNLAEDIID